MADDAAKTPDASPCPVRYCPVQHGDVLFPEIVIANLADDGFDPYVHLALIRRHLCRAAGSSGMRCDPAACRSGLAAIGPNGPGGTVNACKRQWREYYDRAFLHNVADATGAFADALDALGFEIGTQ